MGLPIARLLGFFILLETSTAFARVGVLIGSFGDIDHPKTELRAFVRKTLTDPDILPLPTWARHGIANIGWFIERNSLFNKYAAIGGSSHMRRESDLQALKVQTELRLQGIDANAYTGFTMTFPFVENALKQAQADGVTRLIVLHQGAQYARDTVGILMRHVQDYIKDHPEWQVDVRGVMSYSDDPRFLDLIKTHINRGLAEGFPATRQDDICILLPIHGAIANQHSEPYMAEINRITESLKATYGPKRVHIGFQNHDQIPLITWTKPEVDQVISTLNCPAILINGMISFTVDNLETLYDHHIEAVETIYENAKRKGQQRPQIVVQRVWNGHAEFARFQAHLVNEVLDGTRPSVNLQE